MKTGSGKIAAIAAVAALVGASVGAGAYALFKSDGGTTVVRPVQVTQSLQAADKSGSALSIGSIYKLAYKGVVKITVTSNGDTAAPFNDQAQRAQGSGFVYSTNGDVITNQHVVDGADLDQGHLLERQDLQRLPRRRRPLHRHGGDQGRRADLDAASARGRRLEFRRGR